MNSIRQTWVAVVVCLLTLVACQEEQPPPASSPRGVLLEMNAKLREGMDLAQELRDAVDRGDPLDPDKLERAREIAEEVEEIKRRFMELLPDVAGMPFKQVYQQFRFLDSLINLAKTLGLQLEIGTGTNQTKDLLKKLLRILEREKDWLWNHWPNLPNAGFESMDNTIDAVRRRLENPNDTGDRFFEILMELEQLKYFAAGELPDRVYGKDLGFWYYRLVQIDTRAKQIEYFVQDVEKDFNEETTLELQDWFFSMELLKGQMIEHVTD